MSQIHILAAKDVLLILSTRQKELEDTVLHIPENEDHLRLFSIFLCKGDL